MQATAKSLTLAYQIQTLKKGAENIQGTLELKSMIIAPTWLNISNN